MITDIKELVTRLVYYRENPATGKLELANPNGPEAADALEAMAGEVERLTNEVAKERGNADQNSMQRDKARAERDRLKAALNKKLSAKARQKLGDLSESMIAMGEGRALEMLLNWYDDSRKALGGDE